MTKLKLYVGKQGRTWWWEVAPEGRRRPRDEMPTQLGWGGGIPTWGQALQRGLAALDAKQVSHR